MRVGIVVLLVLLLLLVLVLRSRAPAPRLAPEPSALPAVPVAQDQAQMILDGMTTREKICQLLVIQPEDLPGVQSPVKELTDELTAALKLYPVGGILLTTYNFDTRAQTVRLTHALQAASKLPMLLTVDEEGGRVGRLMYTVGTTALEPMFSYREEGRDTAYANAVTLARDLTACGFNADLAPVADVWSNPANEVIGDRAYSDDYEGAAALVSAAVEGFRDENVICCLKHFPGHGSTETDSHEEAAIVNKPLNTLLREELLPFQSGIDAGADMVMVGHLTVPTLDDRPATMSYHLVTRVLRQQLGFHGVIITDGLEMEAAGKSSDGEKAVRCLQAGCDLLLGLRNIPGTVAAIEQALEDGTLTMEQLDESVLRVLTMKIEHGVISAEP